jgi:hypothetical protein
MHNAIAPEPYDADGDGSRPATHSRAWQSALWSCVYGTQRVCVACVPGASEILSLEYDWYRNYELVIRYSRRGIVRVALFIGCLVKVLRTALVVARNPGALGGLVLADMTVGATVLALTVVCTLVALWLAGRNRPLDSVRICACADILGGCLFTIVDIIIDCLEQSASVAYTVISVVARLIVVFMLVQIYVGPR